MKILSHYKKNGYIINVLQQTACLVVNQITVDNLAFLFNCTLVGQTSDSVTVPAHLCYLLDFFCSGIQFYESLSLVYLLLYLDLYVSGDNSWLS